MQMLTNPFRKIFTTARSYKILLLPALLIFSCTTADRDKDGIPDPKDKCPDVYAKTKDGCPVEKQIGSVHFYIDNSASMGGYFKKNAEFNEVISDLTAKIDKEIKPIDIAFIAEKMIPYLKPVQQFSADIAQTPPANQRSSQLQTMIGKIADRNDSNDVSLLVSDCILSFPDEVIRSKGYAEINRDKAPSTLKNSIYQSFYDLKKKGIATSVYAFTSKFYGTYYDYHNRPKTLAGESRPFYVWVIGNKELLSRFNTALTNISSFRPLQSLHFGGVEEAVEQFNLLSQVEKSGKWKWNKAAKTISDIQTKEGEQQFCVALNLDNLPPYARTSEYVKKNLQVKGEGCEIELQDVKDKQTADQSKLKSIPEKKAFDEASHFLIFTIKILRVPEATVAISLPLQYDNWYEDWSTMDDTEAGAMRNKTFALQYLIAGVRDAYETRNKNYIDFAIHLKQ